MHICVSYVFLLGLVGTFDGHIQFKQMDNHLMLYGSNTIMGTSIDKCRCLCSRDPSCTCFAMLSNTTCITSNETYCILEQTGSSTYIKFDGESCIDTQTAIDNKSVFSPWATDECTADCGLCGNRTKTREWRGRGAYLPEYGVVSVNEPCGSDIACLYPVRKCCHGINTRRNGTFVCVER